MGIGNHRVQRGPCHIAPLLGKQVDDVKLLKGDKSGHHRRRGDNGPDGGHGDGPGARPEPRPVQGGALIEAAVHALECPVDGGDHKGQGHPQVQHHAGQEGDSVTGQEIHFAKAQQDKKLIEYAKLGVEHSHPPQQDGDISGHRPRHHEQGLVNPLESQPRRIQSQSD